MSVSYTHLLSNTKITMDYTDSLNGSGGWSRVPWENVNILPLGSQFNIDARVSKTVPFTARLHGTFALDAFNATNHRNISAVQTLAYTCLLYTSKALRECWFIAANRRATCFNWTASASPIIIPATRLT